MPKVACLVLPSFHRASERSYENKVERKFPQNELESSSAGLQDVYRVGKVNWAEAAVGAERAPSGRVYLASNSTLRLAG